MADITISDLELAPALTDDMVFPVENTTDTYAATLAMLRRLLNKTFVEVNNADFNALTDDGFYQCTGTPTNSPEAGAINWTLQVSAESGVVVQRAFSLDDNFANLYIRRWNGVTWTAWIEEGGGALTHKANIDLDNLSNTGEAHFANPSLSNLSAAGQAKFDAKANTSASNFTSTGKQNVVGWMGINTSSSIARALNTTYTATRDCWIFHNENANNTSLFYVNGVVVYQTQWHAGLTSAKGSALVFVKKGQTWRAENGSSVTEFGTMGG